MEISTSIAAQAPHCNYSESDQVYKRYKHTLYSYLLKDVPENMNEETFEIENHKYAWKSIEELEEDSNVKERTGLVDNVSIDGAVALIT